MGETIPPAACSDPPPHPQIDCGRTDVLDLFREPQRGFPVRWFHGQMGAVLTGNGQTRGGRGGVVPAAPSTHDLWSRPCSCYWSDGAVREPLQRGLLLKRAGRARIHFKICMCDPGSKGVGTWGGGGGPGTTQPGIEKLDRSEFLECGRMFVARS